MVNRVQTLRSSVAGNLPASGTRQPGELWVNFADKQIGYIDASQIAQKLQAVRFFSTLSTYAIGDCVWNAGNLYCANVAVSPGAFNATQWILIGGSSAAYLPLGGGTLTGALTISTGNLTMTAGNIALNGAAATISTSIGGKISGGQLVASLNAASTSQIISNTWGNFGASTSGFGYFSSNLYNDASTGGWKIGTTHASLGYGAVYVSNAGAYWGGATGAVTGGAVVTPAWNKLWSQADFNYAPVNKAGDAMSGQLGINTGAGNYPLVLGCNAGSNCAASYTISGGHAYYWGSWAASGSFGLYDNNAAAWRLLCDINGIWTVGTGEFQFGDSSGASGWDTSTSISTSPAAARGLRGLSCWAGGAASQQAIFSRVDRTDCLLVNFGWGTATQVGSITTNGTTTTYSTTCDRRMKENIRPLSSEIEVGPVIDKLEPVVFNWKPVSPAPEDTTRRPSRGLGFVAQDLFQIIPEAVSPGLDEYDEKNQVGMWGADFSKIVPYLVAEVQALRRRVAQLEGA